MRFKLAAAGMGLALASCASVPEQVARPDVDAMKRDRAVVFHPDAWLTVYADEQQARNEYRGNVLAESRRHVKVTRFYFSSDGHSTGRVRPSPDEVPATYLVSDNARYNPRTHTFHAIGRPRMITPSGAFSGSAREGDHVSVDADGRIEKRGNW